MVFTDAEILKRLLADGGDGTLEVAKHYINGENITITVSDSLFRSINTSYLYSEEIKIANIVMAEASA